MSQATQDLWARNRARTDPLGTLRDVGIVDISIQVSVSAGMDERQTPMVLLTLNPAQWRTVRRILDPFMFGNVRHDGFTEYRLTMELDDCSNLASLLDDDGNWSDTVTELRKALGLAGCWVELQEGP